MISRIHQKLGTAGFVISIVALVAALGGGAYAASGGLSGKQKKEVEKIAKKYAGKPGAVGATGPAGPSGATGAKADAGAAGVVGPQGPEGKQGDPGIQGIQGKQGKEGLSGFTETLPEGNTETGVWTTPITTTIDEAEGFPLRVPISFPIPLAAPLDGSHVVYIKENVTAPQGCIGGTAEAPIAEPGFLCVYGNHESFLQNTGITKSDPSETAGAGTTGALLRFSVAESDEFASGTFAVTAEE